MGQIKNLRALCFTKWTPLSLILVSKPQKCAKIEKLTGFLAITPHSYLDELSFSHGSMVP